MTFAEFIKSKVSEDSPNGDFAKDFIWSTNGMGGVKNWEYPEVKHHLRSHGVDDFIMSLAKDLYYEFLLNDEDDEPCHLTDLTPADLEDMPIPERNKPKKQVYVHSDNETKTNFGGVHGDLIWQGRQWSVTSIGMEERTGRYHIDVQNLKSNDHISNYGWLTHMQSKGWVDMPDFLAAYAIARLFHLNNGEDFK